MTILHSSALLQQLPASPTGSELSANQFKRIIAQSGKSETHCVSHKTFS
jgi:hypothetical protein